MNRVITQIGQSIYEWFFTKPAQDNMVALGKLAAAVLGTSPIANGLPCTPTSPASLQVTIGAGEIYALGPLEATAYGTLPADTTHQIIKQGISLDPVLVSCAPPPTGGQAINYLIQVQYQDLDVSLDPTTGSAAPVVLQFYNSSNPSQPWQGPNNTGQTSNTFRKGVVAIQPKAGIAAATGTQVTPVPDAGWTGLWVVTVANGQSTITAGNITPYAGAPILNETLTQKISQASGDVRYTLVGQSVGVVGMSRNARMVVTVASSTATYTADELIVETALGGLRYALANVNDTFNLATDMDTGSAPTNGFVACYRLFNPTTQATLRRIVNCTSVVAPEIYAGAAAPAGFTASALVATVPTNASGQFSPVSVKDRHVDTAGIAVMSATAYQAAYTSFSIAAAAPLNAKRAYVTGLLGNTTANSASSIQFSGASAEFGVIYVSGSFVPGTGNTLASTGSLPIVTAQTLYWKGGGSGTPAISMNVSGYDF
ncbi:hypothetical protein [Pandoraea pnomenusa]|uniref:hypothetical protein n=1 Tax=Pandoraea pnomenusa TaxID=93220 RepID=UPI00333FD3F6